ncbi:N-acetyltransferase family protein [Roseomonas nepalensis]|uniref:N-acetyltransferase family protein n=1 Tax=Muricoccus nepalensis TaxID=1854500 RepID=A0A502FRV4_9PROT|nr:GNAT family N-acetyltransferase [Roseomonas nepalensis]TPG52307.1 N-acetyltransferase family protein [Roseomonas nepalensis]
MSATLPLDFTLTGIRPASEADMTAITAIYAHHVRQGSASFETKVPDVVEMARRRATLREGGFPYVVAEDNSEVLGYAYAGAYRPRAAYCNTVEDSIYLRPDATGRGLGSHLLTALIEACEAQGFRQMIAVVGDRANTPSIRLHERQGFRRIGTLEAVGCKHGRWLDVVLLQRRLGEGASSAPQVRNA